MWRAFQRITGYVSSFRQLLLKRDFNDERRQDMQGVIHKHALDIGSRPQQLVIAVTGHGMSLVKEIVTLHEGQVDVASELGRGYHKCPPISGGLKTTPR